MQRSCVLRLATPRVVHANALCCSRTSILSGAYEPSARRLVQQRQRDGELPLFRRNAVSSEVPGEGPVDLLVSTELSETLIDEACFCFEEGSGRKAVKIVHQGSAYIVKQAKSAATCQHEQAVLDFLADKGASGVARCIGAGVRRLAGIQTHFLVMTYAGEELPFDELKDLEVREALANLIQEFHSFGVVNGDLKPAHLRRDNRGKLFIVDWDLAALRHDDGGTVVHPWVLEGFQKEAYLPQLPSSRCWGVFQGTKEWAAPSIHLGYGPSVAGDLGSFGLICAAAISGRAPWSEPLQSFSTETPLHSSVMILLTLGLPVVAMGRVHIAPWGCDGGLDWADFWSHQKELALHAHGEGEIEAGAKFVHYLLTLGAQGSTAKVAAPKAAAGPGYFEGSRTVASSAGSKWESPKLGKSEHLLGVDAKETFFEELLRAFGRTEEKHVLASQSQKIIVSDQDYSSFGALQPFDSRGVATIEPDVWMVTDSDKDRAFGVLSEPEPHFLVESATPRRLLKAVEIDEDAVSSTGTPAALNLLTAAGAVRLIVSEIILTKNSASLINKLGQIEIDLYAAGAAGALGTHPLQVLDLGALAIVMYGAPMELPTDFALDRLYHFPRCFVQCLLGKLVFLCSTSRAARALYREKETSMVISETYQKLDEKIERYHKESMDAILKLVHLVKRQRPSRAAAEA